MTEGKSTIEVKLECRGCGRTETFTADAPYGIAWPDSGNMDPRYWTRFGNELGAKVEKAGWQAAPVWCPDCIAKGLADELEHEAARNSPIMRFFYDDASKYTRLKTKPYEHPMLKKQEE